MFVQQSKKAICLRLQATATTKYKRPCCFKGDVDKE